jgi:hypothetical protein
VLERERKQSRSGRPTAKEPQRSRTQGLTLPQPAGGLVRATLQWCIQRWSPKRAEECFPHVRVGVPAKNRNRFYHQLSREKTPRINGLERYTPAVVSTPNSVSFRRLFELLDERGEDDYGKIDPTQYAFKNACVLALTAEEMLGRDIKCSPVVDSEGGIRVTWKNQNKQVKLICPATVKAPIYIYESSPDGSTIYDKDVTSIALAKRLSWLLDGDQSNRPRD